MENLGFFYNAAVCIGCRACQVACQEKNKLVPTQFGRRVEAIETTQDGVSKWVFFSGSCNHCQNPACTSVCPTGAMYKAEDGTVLHRDDLCIGCGRCVHHCPYGAVSLNKTTGYAQKCDSCAARRAEGRAPACVEACPMRALQFSPMEELKEKYGAHGAELPFLPCADMTHPNLLIGGTPPSVHTTPAAAVEETPLPEPKPGSGMKVLILGSGAAALSAVQELRRLDDSVQITMVSREKRLPYSRPMLSKGLLGSFAADRYPIVSPDWLDANTDYIRDTVTALDPDGHTVTLQSGRVLEYDKCIYALGMDCFVPPIPGHDLSGVFTLRDDTDLHAIRLAMLTAQKAVVVGGGITGLEMAWEMKKAGLEVTVLDMVDQLLGRILDPYTAKGLRNAVEAGGIDVSTGVQIAALEGEAAVTGVRLQDGTIYPADLVLLSTGYRANTAPAQAAGLATGRAVTVDDHLFTSHPDILACGDCASNSTATWLQSIAQGKLAAANALGYDLCWKAPVEPALVHTADTSLLAVGDLGKDPNKTYTWLLGHANEDPSRFYINPRTSLRSETELTFCFSDGRLTGAALLGSLSLMDFVEKALAEGWKEAALRAAALEKGVQFHDR